MSIKKVITIISGVICVFSIILMFTNTVDLGIVVKSCQKYFFIVALISSILPIIEMRSYYRDHYE